MYNSAQELVETLRATSQILEALLRQVSDEQARSARGGDENWSVVEVVCHLRDAEERAVERMRAMRDEESPRLRGYDQEAWARERNYAAQDLHTALAGFLRLRQTHASDLAGLPPAAWERPGRHEEHGPVTISNHTQHIVAHDAAHLAQIVRQLAPRMASGPPVPEQ